MNNLGLPQSDFYTKVMLIKNQGSKTLTTFVVNWMHHIVTGVSKNNLAQDEFREYLTALKKNNCQLKVNYFSYQKVLALRERCGQSQQWIYSSPNFGCRPQRSRKGGTGSSSQFRERRGPQGQRPQILEYDDADPSGHCHSEKVFLLEASLHVFLFYFKRFSTMKSHIFFLAVH